MTFAELEYDSKKRRTRREIFLEKMEPSLPTYVRHGARKELE